VIILRIALYPFAMLYGLIVAVRNQLFDWKILASEQFKVPVISIGNLSTGGTGKTPHIEFLINLLSEHYQIAVISRGYKRKSKGFVLAKPSSKMEDLGDEPMQLHRKFPDLIVAVDEKRRRGIRQLLKLHPDIDVVLMDDGFQHRYVTPGYSILLTDYHKLYSGDYMLPTGNLREFRSGAKRADMIVVTKSPKILSPITVRQIHASLKVRPHQDMAFTFLHHDTFRAIPGMDYIPAEKETFNTILMVTGIANNYPLEDYLKAFCDEIEKMEFRDHHFYSVEDIELITEVFHQLPTKKKMIVTTEKDAIRMVRKGIFEMVKKLPVCYVPIHVELHKAYKDLFTERIENYVEKNQRDQ
jgi:tetraacyldisaccharide 4'-kinase